ncbi:MarR family winged helix-turn-helix transcriptional regulator [Microbacterium sp. P06]|uniref:MarR family winged helix-turn-helix transcriptional regulator n=1 Tax=Microbacterium sp. P06 TaxID=3366949 RepID=UPI003744B353
MDDVDRILEQWRAERPDLDVSPMGVVGRLSRAASAIETRLAQTFAQHGIDAPTFDVLATLARQGPPYRATPSTLAAEAMITSSAVAQRLNRLVDLGFVTRAPHPQDGRGKLVALTAAGKRTLDEVLPDHLTTEEEALAPLSAAERRTLAELLGRLAENELAP